LKKTLVITEVFYPEDFVINDLVAHWAASGKEIEVLTRVPSYPKGVVFDGFKNSLYQKSQFHGVKVHHIPFVRGYQKSGVKKILNYINYIFFSFWFLLFKGSRYDRIFIYQTGPLSNAFSATCLKWMFNWKIIIWTQDLWPETVYAYGVKETRLSRFFLNRLVKFIYKRSDEIFVSCKGFIPKIERYVHNKSYHWIPNWTLVEAGSINDVTFQEGFNFTFAGNIGKVQNLENLVVGFHQVIESFPNAYFNIIGDGSNLDVLKKMVADRNINNVIFHGRKTLDAMPDYFAASDVLVLSLIDSPIYEIMIPSKFQAYLNARKPIFSIVSGELNNLVEEYEIGITASPNNLHSIAIGFKSFLQMTESNKSKMTERCAELESKYFDKKKTMDELTNITFNQ
jgi:glycosyltransferase involved in cell wall biosynthesis